MKYCKYVVFCAFAVSSTKGFSGGVTGGTGVAIVSPELSEDGMTGGTPGLSEGIIDLTPAEMIEAMNHGLSGKPFVLQRTEGILKLKPESFDFLNKSIRFESEIGEKLIGRQLLQQ